MCVHHHSNDMSARSRLQRNEQRVNDLADEFRKKETHYEEVISVSDHAHLSHLSWFFTSWNLHAVETYERSKN